jgi:ubiquinone/menaquinone biosynthesis C-methylase UbiE
MYSYLIGKGYGENPAESVDKILRDKQIIADVIVNQLGLQSSQTVLDMGSGPGWVARSLAPRVRHLHCCDISESFLRLARRECAGVDNISFHQIKPGVLGEFRNDSIDAIYSLNVFIHMNLYQVSIYLKEFSRVLKPGGKVWLDFAGDDVLTAGIPPIFKEMEFHYSHFPDRIQALIQFYSKEAIVGLAKSNGLKLRHFYISNSTSRTVVFEKAN